MTTRDDVPPTADPAIEFALNTERAGALTLYALRAENERLHESLRIRDNFIASHGLWGEFVDTVNGLIRARAALKDHQP